ncbi:MAG: AAA family ATPase [Gammaproteobacteria bacterium]|nr:AAA family ATPase [Gammaproteobacteria bacterium]
MESITESLTGIIQRVTFHSAESGWSVLRVQPFNAPESQETVVVHQTQVFAGATMEFEGNWTTHPKFGRQFKASKATEKKPASAAALEKYLGSGLIKGVGPKTAKRIVRHFKSDTLSVFENEIERLTEVTGIASRKLVSIRDAWEEHCSIRDVMMFLQGHGISTLFAVRIFKSYGEAAIQRVMDDPYALARDFYGIGFFSADKVALSLGVDPRSPLRVMAAIRHALSASRDAGHCYLTQSQIEGSVSELLELSFPEGLSSYLQQMAAEDQLRIRKLEIEGQTEHCFYSKSLYYDELNVATIISQPRSIPQFDRARIQTWIRRYCEKLEMQLSVEQAEAVLGIVQQPISVLTGGPGCGKTTTTLVIVRLLEAMGRKIFLAAPTGRAAQRMSEVIGREAKTIHRLLEWQNGSFQKSQESPLECDYLIVDECSMLDISLSAALLQAISPECQLLLIGDADQLPSVGAGNVLHDLIASATLPCFHLTEVFRQARQSKIIQAAHQINQGRVPPIDSPFHQPEIWQQKSDCLFIDSEEATQEQLSFIRRAKQHLQEPEEEDGADPHFFRIEEAPQSAYELEFSVPDKFMHVDLGQLVRTTSAAESLKMLMKRLHPWSSLHYNLSALEVLTRLYLEWIPKYYPNQEIQILSPMTRGSVGTFSLNQTIQDQANPTTEGKAQLKIGDRIFRVGDRVIHRRNNYDLNVFNGDIGHIIGIDNETITCRVAFLPDQREIIYQKEQLVELELAYAITIHKSQGSEFAVVIIPLLTQHFKMLYRNLIYTGLTRARKLVVIVGSRRALAMAVHQQDTRLRQTALQQLLCEGAKQRPHGMRH